MDATGWRWFTDCDVVVASHVVVVVVVDGDGDVDLVDRRRRDWLRSSSSASRRSLRDGESARRSVAGRSPFEALHAGATSAAASSATNEHVHVGELDGVHRRCESRRAGFDARPRAARCRAARCEARAGPWRAAASRAPGGTRGDEAAPDGARSRAPRSSCPALARPAPGHALREGELAALRSVRLAIRRPRLCRERSRRSGGSSIRADDSAGRAKSKASAEIS